MKLYATIESERASKGQGGNDYLDIKVTFEDNSTIRPFRAFRITMNKNGYPIIKGYPLQEEKAKRQKGECTKGCAYHTKDDNCTDLPS